MLKLVAKDLRAQRGLMLFWGLYSLCFYAPALFLEDWSPSLGFVLVLIPVVVGLLFVIGAAKAENAGAELLVASFPVSRRMLADVKFVGMALAAAYGFATSLAFGLLFGAATARIGLGGLDWLILPRIVAGLGLLSWLIPLYLRYGSDFIRKFAVIGLATAVAAQGVLAILVGRRDGAFAEAFGELARAYRSRPPEARSLAFAAAGLGVGLVSWIAARRIMARKEF